MEKVDKNNSRKRPSDFSLLRKSYKQAIASALIEGVILSKDREIKREAKKFAFEK